MKGLIGPVLTIVGHCSERKILSDKGPPVHSKHYSLLSFSAVITLTYFLTLGCWVSATAKDKRCYIRRCMPYIYMRLAPRPPPPVWEVIYTERESVLYHGIKTQRSVLKNEAVGQVFNNFEVFWDRGKELFLVLYIIASQTNQYLKRKLMWKLS